MFSSTILLLDQIFIFIYILVLFVIIYLKFRSRVLDFGLALFIGAAISEGIKYLVNKPRPAMSPILTDITRVFEGSSFPSTHTTIAFTAFFFYLLVCLFPPKKKNRGDSNNIILNKYIQLILFFVGAFIIGGLRIVVGAHFPIDVFAGIILGFIIALPFRYYDVVSRRVK